VAQSEALTWRTNFHMWPSTSWSDPHKSEWSPAWHNSSWDYPDYDYNRDRWWHPTNPWQNSSWQEHGAHVQDCQSSVEEHPDINSATSSAFKLEAHPVLNQWPWQPEVAKVHIKEQKQQRQQQQHATQRAAQRQHKKWPAGTLITVSDQPQSELQECNHKNMKKLQLLEEYKKVFPNRACSKKTKSELLQDLEEEQARCKAEWGDPHVNRSSDANIGGRNSESCSSANQFGVCKSEPKKTQVKA